MCTIVEISAMHLIQIYHEFKYKINKQLPVLKGLQALVKTEWPITLIIFVDSEYYAYYHYLQYNIIFVALSFIVHELNTLSQFEHKTSELNRVAYTTIQLIASHKLADTGGAQPAPPPPPNGRGPIYYLKTKCYYKHDQNMLKIQY